MGGGCTGSLAHTGSHWLTLAHGLTGLEWVQVLVQLVLGSWCMVAWWHGGTWMQRPAYKNEHRVSNTTRTKGATCLRQQSTEGIVRLV